MGILNTILAFFGALAAYIKYRYDPETIAKQDAIHKRLTEENGYDSVAELLRGQKTLDLSSFISEYMRSVRAPQADSSSGRPGDLLTGVLPKPRDKKDIDSDNNPGLE